MLVAFRWLAFRVEFGAGLIELRGDRCWRELSCMDHHHETQPMPNPLSWFFHRLPTPTHRLEVAGNFVAQLALRFGLFAWLNWVTIRAIVAAIAAIAAIADPSAVGAAYQSTPGWFTGVVLAVTVMVVARSWWPIRNMASSGQAMNASFNPFRLANTYGALGTVSRERIEVRARFFSYRFTSWQERRELGAWWVRRFEAGYLPPVGLGDLRRAGA